MRLLVFDNCEHVLDAAADLVEAILARSATVRILATSREGLGVADEQLWPVPSLDVGAGIDSAAVALFVERAQAVSSRFSIGNPEEAAAVVEICRRLDGIPLAIELAASRMASMTAGEVRDRLDQRFRLLVGSRRGLERHHTLRHAVAWSYDLLNDAEKALLERCSVFAGGFDLQSACAVAGFDDADDYAILDLLDALVRKSLLVADRSSGRTRFSMLETIRQFAEEQLVASRRSPTRPEPPMPATSPSAKPKSWPCGTAPASGRRTTGSPSSWPTCAPHSAGPPTTAILTSPRPSPPTRGCSVTWSKPYEPIAWAEELIEPARAVDHPRLALLYVIASQCCETGRIEAAVGYSDAGQIVLGRSREAVPYGFEGLLGVVYLAIGQPERLAEWCRAQLACRRDTHVLIRAWLVVALSVAGCGGEAMDSAGGLIEAAEATGNPHMLAWALTAYGFAFRDADPVGALNALGRGLVIAQDSGNRAQASAAAPFLARLEAEHGDTVSAFDHLTLAIRNYHNSGDTTTIRVPLAILAALFDRLGRYEPAATTAGFALSPMAAAGVPEITTAIAHLRDVLGDQTYESLARNGEAMTTAAIVAYAYDQIDQARAELNAVSK